jgi:hypothetical protein
MFPSINPVKKLQRDLADEMDGQDSNLAVAGPQPATGISELLKSFGSSIDDPLPVPLRTRPGDWSGLIDRIRETARHVRDVEAQARQRDVQMDDLIQQVRGDMAEAEARVRSAEARSVALEAQAMEMIRAAEARAAAAEERARVAEEWLMRIQEIIQSEFSGANGAAG